ncbi:hypothetical protein NDU88_010134 [Pleurodeles waltl]|uniref:Uncharacterized protein n=1 Tax=Pleurodeles waltl TaxID=8319 RepID=A0AAV7S0E8_PLEWA|nr:hypothetical protein NDU88_010134 [Pleurodeles waltl]
MQSRDSQQSRAPSSHKNEHRQPNEDQQQGDCIEKRCKRLEFKAHSTVQKYYLKRTAQNPSQGSRSAEIEPEVIRAGHWHRRRGTSKEGPSTDTTQEQEGKHIQNGQMEEEKNCCQGRKQTTEEGEPSSAPTRPEVDAEPQASSIRQADRAEHQTKVAEQCPLHRYSKCYMKALGSKENRPQWKGRKPNKIACKSKNDPTQQAHHVARERDRKQSITPQTYSSKTLNRTPERQGRPTG